MTTKVAKGRTTNNDDDKVLSAREWLREHGYDEIAEVIDKLEGKWLRAGRKTRRDWWAALAGRPNGQPCIIGGHTFPILKAARVRQGLEPVAGALENKRGESCPAVRPTPHRKATRKAA